MGNLLERANELGRDAIRSGRKSAPFLDPKLMKMIKANSENKEFGWTNQVFDAWSDGFHAMILGR